MPIVTLGSTSFLWVREEDVYLVAVTRCNANAALVFEFLYRFQSIWRTSFRAPLCEETVKKNFALVYELLDEIVDFGYPQNSEMNALKMYTANDDLRLDDGFRGDDLFWSISPPSHQQQAQQQQQQQQISWRRPDVRYRKNECYVDVIETMHVLLSSEGTLLRSDVDGQVMMRAYLSGMPECSIGLSTDVGIDTSPRPSTSTPPTASAVKLSDCSFHPCVQLDTLERDRSIHFVPLDGDFELMRYRATDHIQLPLEVRATVEEVRDQRVVYTVHLRATLEPHLHANQVTVRIPTPRNAARARCSVQTGRAKLEAEEHAIVWRLPKVPGRTEHVLHAEATLVPAAQLAQPWRRPPIDVHFSVLMFVASGFGIRYLKVTEKSQYRSVKWVRYVTRAAGSYQIRI